MEISNTDTKEISPFEDERTDKQRIAELEEELQALRATVNGLTRITANEHRLLD